MEAIRELVKTNTDTLELKIPDSYIKQNLEIIIMKTTENKSSFLNKKKRPSVGAVTSEPVSLESDAFKPLNTKELKDWGLT